MSISPFHLAIPVRELQETRAFYNEILGCNEGRTDVEWVDLDFYGHQLVLHKVDEIGERHSNPVDGHQVPVPHFGVVLKWKEWEGLRDRLVAAGVKFQIEPYVRFKGLPGEQATMFCYDPSGNALEFKAFKNIDQLFAK